MNRAGHSQATPEFKSGGSLCWRRQRRRSLMTLVKDSADRHIPAPTIEASTISSTGSASFDWFCRYASIMRKAGPSTKQTS